MLIGKADVVFELEQKLFGGHVLFVVWFLELDALPFGNLRLLGVKLLRTSFY